MAKITRQIRRIATLDRVTELAIEVKRLKSDIAYLAVGLLERDQYQAEFEKMFLRGGYITQNDLDELMSKFKKKPVEPAEPTDQPTEPPKGSVTLT